MITLFFLLGYGEPQSSIDIIAHPFVEKFLGIKHKNKNNIVEPHNHAVDKPGQTAVIQDKHTLSLENAGGQFGDRISILKSKPTKTSKRKMDNRNALQQNSKRLPDLATGDADQLPSVLNGISHPLVKDFVGNMPKTNEENKYQTMNSLPKSTQNVIKQYIKGLQNNNNGNAKKLQGIDAKKTPVGMDVGIGVKRVVDITRQPLFNQNAVVNTHEGDVSKTTSVKITDGRVNDFVDPYYATGANINGQNTTEPDLDAKQTMKTDNVLTRSSKSFPNYIKLGHDFQDPYYNDQARKKGITYIQDTSKIADFTDPYYVPSPKTGKGHQNANIVGHKPFVSLPINNIPKKNDKQTKEDIKCKHEDSLLPSVFVKLKGLELPLCMNLNLPSNSHVTLIKHGEEALDVETNKCEGIDGKRFYSAEYINAAYIPDHQLTLYTNMILSNHSFREWREQEFIDLPFPNDEMKIKVCRSHAPLHGLQFLVNVDSTNTGYSGLLGSLANMKVVKFTTKLNLRKEQTADIIIRKDDRQFCVKATLRYGASRLALQCWRTFDTGYFDKN